MQDVSLAGEAHRTVLFPKAMGPDKSVVSLTGTVLNLESPLLGPYTVANATAFSRPSIPRWLQAETWSRSKVLAVWPKAGDDLEIILSTTHLEK